MQTMTMLPDPLLAHAAQVLRALAHPKRMRLAEILLDGPLPVHELSQRSGMPQPQTSHHLRILQRFGLLADERRGAEVYYRVQEPMLETIFGCLRTKATVRV